MLCHKCPTNLDIQSGKFASTPWERTPCASCNFTESSFSLEYDPNRDKRPTPDASALAADIDMLPVSVLTEMAAGLLRLSPQLRDVVTRRLTGESFRQIAESEKISIQAAEQRLKAAFRRYPAISYAFPRKLAKQKTRRRKTLH